MRSLFNGELPACVMFDLDGTLVDSALDLTAAVDNMLQALGREPAGEDRVRQWVGNGAQVLVKRALSGEMYPTEEAVEPELFQAAFDVFLAAYAQSNGRYSKLYPGVEELLACLRQASVPMAVITNKPIAFTTPLLKALSIDHYFDQVLGGDSLPVKKPDPLPLLTVLEAAGCAPEQALMLGDSRNDVVAARAAGCPVICVSYGYNHGEPVEACSPDRVVDSFAELM
ncbi:phosphoglycolate phosphatase [Marinobacterium sediminicola]|uniref:Phosphoglycolate phosphatase n=1 Tax=Marinobacterium sediminicola TaxID=518898 RepID=A0ABY1RY33_9GAMM|nr:phosphoglycolate phosphatase [Marinobacterium sediminicola]ULG68693.1 phosphoglycolate phosphatase [Marinobacterium sediminicola]SMR73217.1 phosphoglycolate phosphatase [Marinobacterium sediminicola]